MAEPAERERPAQRERGNPRPHTRRPGEPFQRAIDRLIADARGRGAFDNLPGAGKSLELTRNPHEGDAWLTHHVLKNAGYAPEWLELSRQIEQQRTALAEVLQRWRQATAAARCALDRRYRQAAAQLNTDISRFNQVVPAGLRKQQTLVPAVPGDAAGR